jgi:glutamate racemase
MKHITIFVFSILLSIQAFGQSIDGAMRNRQSFYYVNFKQYPVQDKTLPVGVFDSGTGGLTVLNAIVNFDKFENQTNKNTPDGQPDFAKEKFIYLADQANMPYGNYAAAGKTDLLQEHVLKDVQFLLGNKYYQNGQSAHYQTDKQKIKVLVIACNTATAYGQSKIEAFLKTVGLPIKVIGVIDAGSRGALQTFKKDENGSIGIFATAGTVASQGYDRAIRRFQAELGYTGQIQLFGQGGVGLAEAIDEDPNFINRTAQTPREAYRGPNVSGANLLIEKQLLKIYNFDFEGQKMLCDASKVDDCSQLQINSAENYVRYHLVTLLEKMRLAPNVLPLKTLILGCTHYPYMAEPIEKVLTELRNYEENGQPRYKHLLAEKITLIDPAINTARELYDYLYASKSFNTAADMTTQSEFYISVPNALNPNIKTETDGRFTYDYKYGRNANELQEYVKAVPFSNKNISPDVTDRLRKQIPNTFELIKRFGKNPKTSFMGIGETIVE